MESVTLRSRLIAVVEGFGLTISGTVAGILSVLVISIGINATGVPTTDAVQLLRSRAIQVGFLLVALGYLLLRNTASQYAKIHIPTLHGVAWIVAIPILLAGIGYLLDPVIAALGIAPPGSTGGDIAANFVSRPLLWLVVFVGWFVFAAPAEELLFRGIIQGRLRESFDAAASVFLAACFFGFMHVPVAILSTGLTPISSFIEAFVGGVVFGVAYERTDNLLIPSIAHAGLWTGGLIIG